MSSYSLGFVSHSTTSKTFPHLRIALGCALGVQRHLVHALDLVPLLPQQQRRPRPRGGSLHPVLKRR